MFYLIARFLVMLLCKIIFRLQVNGRENIPAKGGFILASNHTSYLDPPIVGVSCPRVLYFVAKEELFRNSLFAHLMTALNVFPIKNQPGELKSLRRAIRELKAGKGLTIFPEGRRTADGQLGEPMKGVGLLAAKADVPIIPVFIQGSNQALPVHSKFIRPKKIRIYFGKAFWPQEFSTQLNEDDFYEAIATRTMEEIRRLKVKQNH